MKKPVNRLGQAIKEARRAQGLTREALAERTDISPRYLANIENSNKNPSFKVISNIARELSLSVDASIFPEKSVEQDKKAEIIEKIDRCSIANLEIIEALVDALIRSQNRHER